MEGRWGGEVLVLIVIYHCDRGVIPARASYNHTSYQTFHIPAMRGVSETVGMALLGGNRSLTRPLVVVNHAMPGFVSSFLQIKVTVGPSYKLLLHHQISLGTFCLFSIFE